MPNKTKINVLSPSLPFSRRHKQRYIVFLVLILFPFILFYFLLYYVLLLACLYVCLYFIQVYYFEKMLLTFFIQLNLYLIQNKLSLILLTYKLQDMFWVFLFPFFYEDVEFDKIYAFVNEIIFFCINIITPLHIFVIEKCNNFELWWIDTIQFYTKNRTPECVLKG